MRYAIYFTPPSGDRLTAIAAEWLGRNAFTEQAGEPLPVANLTAAEIAYHTASPRRYGFHGTLKAPFELAEGVGEADLLRAMMHFCSTVRPFHIPQLELHRLGGFFALTPGERVDRLDELAAQVVRAFDRFRAPLSEADIERRSPEGLSRRQFSNLTGWGYPFVFDEFRFHMTLTGGLTDPDEIRRVGQALEHRFAPVVNKPLAVENLALFVEPEPGAPFSVHSLHPLGKVEVRKTA